jgi:glycosyltransferase involved in cell wall biosynthesis
VKIIHVPRRFTAGEWGGTETTILETSRALVSMGHQCRILTSMALADRSVETVDGIGVRRFPYCYPFLGLTGEQVAEMDRKGGNLMSFSMLAGLLREPSVDIFHAHSGKRLGGIVRTAARLRRRPYVISLHGGVFDVPQTESARMLEPIRGKLEWGRLFGALLGSRRVLQDAAAIICVGANEARAARKALPNSRVEFIPNGVDSGRFASGDAAAFRARHGIPSDRRVILCVSRIDYQKNQIGLLQAMPEVLREAADTHLVLVGPVTIEDYHRELLGRAAELGLADRLSLIPGLKPDDPQLAGAYHAASVFCLPSLHEPFGIVILEAWAAGLPVVASRIGGIPSFTEDGTDVMLVEPDDPESIARGLLSLLNDPPKMAQLAAAGQRKARLEYDWSKVATRLLAIYQDVSEHQPTGRAGD